MVNKKGIELTLNTVVIAIIVLVVLAVMLLIFSHFAGGGTKPLNCVTKALNEDNDGDKVKDAVYPCPCYNEVPSGCTGPLEEQPSGCPGKGGQCSGGNSCLPEECRGDTK